MHRYCAYDEQTVSFTRRRELPSDRVVGSSTSARRSGSTARRSARVLRRPHDTYAISETRGAQRGVQIDFSPVGAHLLLRIPLHELRSGIVPLDALIGTLLHERLGARGWSLFAVLDDVFLSRLDDALSPVPSVTRALARLRATEGRVAIGELADELGCSRRHLNTTSASTSASPEAVRRILRFQSAVG